MPAKIRSAFNPVNRAPSSTKDAIECYTLAIAIFVVAVGLRLLLLPPSGLPYITFYPAIVITALVCGTRPAILVVALGLLAEHYVFMPSISAANSMVAETPTLAVFAISGIVICLIIDHVFKGLTKASIANKQLHELMSTLEQDIANRKLTEIALRESEHRFRTLFELSSIGVSLCDAISGKYIQVNRKFCEIVGYSLEELNLLTAKEITNPDDFNVQKTKTAALLAGQISEYNIQKRYIKKDGSVVWVDMTCNALWNPTETPTYHLAVVQDISDKKIANAALHAAMEKLADSELENRLILNSAGEGIHGVDLDGNTIFINPAAVRMLGYEMHELLGKSMHELAHYRYPDGSPYPREQCPIFASLTDGQARTITDEVFFRKDGSSFPVEYTCTPMFKKDKLAGAVITFNDISKRKQAEQQMLRLAHYDSITGLPNRVLFLDRLKYELKKSQRANLALALMFIDLDNFKEVNDTLGHDMGDQLLKDAATRLVSCVRDSDTVARLGGDEFTIILSELDDAESVERVAQNILRKFAEAFHLAGELAYISGSIGITLFPKDGAEIEDLLKNADQAMYAAKKQGRNCYRYFTPSMQETAQARKRLANDLRNAIANNQFRIYYQPIVNLATGSINKAEALIRWQHPLLGRIGPTEFIPIAEDTGLIVDIGNWVFQQVAHQVSHWRRAYRDSFQVSINKSPAQFHDDHHQPTAWPDYLRRHNIPGQSIVVEITENLLLKAGTSTTDQLLRFRDAGMEVSLDDFGIGYSSLSYLQKFNIDNLKIDRAFVRNLTPESDDMALCKAIIVMAHTLGMKVIAEGVETAEQRDLLTTAGCDYGQGYLFSRPLPAQEFEAFYFSGLALENWGNAVN